VSTTVNIPASNELIADAERPVQTTPERALSILEAVLNQLGGRANANAMVQVLGAHGIDESTARTSVLELIKARRARRDGSEIVTL